MESDINTKNKPDSKVSRRPSFDKLMDIYWGGPERRISALTLRIIGINAISLIILMIAVINLGRYETEILATKLRSFQKETNLIAQSFTQDTLADISEKELSARLERLHRITGYGIEYRDHEGHVLSRTEQPNRLEDEKKSDVITLSDIASMVVNMLPNRSNLLAYPASDALPLDVGSALKGRTSMSSWQSDEYGVLFSGSAPVFHGNHINGAVYVLRSGQDVVQSIADFWQQMFNIFITTFITTIVISIYLSGTIARPLRKLARSAENMRRTRDKADEIPDMSDRYDEIGELSLVMRDMTESLKNRIDSIERFAADVAHELKNPLTSLKSAIETLGIAKKETDKTRLLDVLSHDVERMDRLITDIASASRLDAELSRETFNTIELKSLLGDILKRYEEQYGKDYHFVCNGMTRPIFVRGNSSRLTQVFDNLLVNALSFAAPNDTIELHCELSNHLVRIVVQDEGKGIPESKLSNIFERFYSERPNDEAFGKHSGLGLSICKDIINSMEGSIKAENRQDRPGARFIITLPREV